MSMGLSMRGCWPLQMFICTVREQDCHQRLDFTLGPQRPAQVAPTLIAADHAHVSSLFCTGRSANHVHAAVAAMDARMRGLATGMICVRLSKGRGERGDVAGTPS